jgi:hypothetical protein
MAAALMQLLVAVSAEATLTQWELLLQQQWIEEQEHHSQQGLHLISKCQQYEQGVSCSTHK